jgi:hypothetical protein
MDQFTTRYSIDVALDDPSQCREIRNAPEPETKKPWEPADNYSVKVRVYNGGRKVGDDSGIFDGNVGHAWPWLPELDCKAILADSKETDAIKQFCNILEKK